jgi:hypothetical protein
MKLVSTSPALCSPSARTLADPLRIEAVISAMAANPSAKALTTTALTASLLP